MRTSSWSRNWGKKKRQKQRLHILTDQLVSISSGSLFLLPRASAGALRPPQVTDVFISLWGCFPGAKPSCPCTQEAAAAPRKPFPSRGCLATSQSQPSPEVAPHRVCGLRLAAGDLNQLPFSQRLKFFKEVSSINQLSIFKSFSPRTCSEQSACWHCFKEQKLISPGWDLSTDEVTGSSPKLSPGSLWPTPGCSVKPCTRKPCTLSVWEKQLFPSFPHPGW